MTDQAPEQPTRPTPPVTPPPPAPAPAPQKAPEAKGEVSQPSSSNTEPDATREADQEALVARDAAVEERVAQYEGDPEAQERVRADLTADTNSEESTS